MSSHIVWITWQEHTTSGDRTVVTDHAHPVHCDRHHEATDTLARVTADPHRAMLARGLPAATAHHPQADLQPVTGCTACTRTARPRTRPTPEDHQ